MDLTAQEATVRCPAGHSFDVARQGYVNLLGHASPRNADTPAMLDARSRFLATGHFDPIAAAISAACTGAARIVEAGAGSAFYLARALDAEPEAWGLATDVSVAAARRACRAHPRLGSVVADTWAGLPIRDGAADVLLCVFAPRNPSEFARVIVPGGRLVVVVPSVTHLRELRERHGLLGVAVDKVESLSAAFAGWPALVRTLDYQVELGGPEAADLIAMGPNAFHTPVADVQGGPCTVSVSVITLTRP